MPMTYFGETSLDVSEKRNIYVEFFFFYLFANTRHFAICLRTSPSLMEFQCIASGNLSVFAPFDTQSYRAQNIRTCIQYEYTTRNRNLTARSSDFLHMQLCGRSKSNNCTSLSVRSIPSASFRSQLNIEGSIITNQHVSCVMV